MKCLDEVFGFITQALETQWRYWAGQGPGRLCLREMILVVKYRVARERVGVEAGDVLWEAVAGIELGTEVRQPGIDKGGWTRKVGNKISLRT